MPSTKNKLEDINTKLKEFITNNPYSKVHKLDEKTYIIDKPWNDESLIIIIPEESSQLIDVLNGVILPQRFTAVYHINDGTIEYIYTRLKTDEPILSREFVFQLEEKQYFCKFDKASESLMEIVDNYGRAKDSKTDFRNLISIEEADPEEEPTSVELVPISFFVKGFEKYNEEEILELSKYMNFFMHYYDRDSPSILMHSQEDSDVEVQDLQYIEGGFPNSISTVHKNPFLMDLVLAAHKVDSRLQFIYCYQLLEYAAFYYVDDEIKRDLNIIISSPDIHSDTEKYIERLLETMADVHLDDEAKVSKLILHTCKTDVIFREIEQHRTYFSNKQEFDGDFILEPFISEDTTLESFRAMWYPKMVNNLRVIRNALVHGREKRFGKVIQPTEKNEKLIRPWCCIVRRIAEQVVLFG